MTLAHEGNKVEKPSVSGFYKAGTVYTGYYAPTTPTTIVSETANAYYKGEIYEVSVWHKASKSIETKYCTASSGNTLSFPFMLASDDLVKVGSFVYGVKDGAEAYIQKVTVDQGAIYEVSVYNVSAKKVGNIKSGDKGTLYMKAALNSMLTSPVSTLYCKIKVSSYNKVYGTLVDGAAAGGEIQNIVTNGTVDKLYKVSVYNTTDHKIGDLEAGASTECYMAGQTTSTSLTSQPSTLGCNLYSNYVLSGTFMNGVEAGGEIKNAIVGGKVTDIYKVDAYNTTDRTINGVAPGKYETYYFTGHSTATSLTSGVSTAGLKLRAGSISRVNIYGSCLGNASSIEFANENFIPGNLYLVKTANTTNAEIAGVPAGMGKSVYLKAIDAKHLAGSASTGGLWVCLTFNSPIAETDYYEF